MLVERQSSIPDATMESDSAADKGSGDHICMVDGSKKGSTRGDLNPYIRLAIYLFIDFMTGCIYWGWNGVQEILYKAGSFEEVCIGAKDISTMRVGKVDYIDCGARKDGVNNLFTIAYSTHFLFSFLSGQLLDRLGPKVCFIIGHFMCGLSWLLVFCFPKNGVVLKLSFVILGLFIEASYTPMITTICRCFPKRSLTVITVMGSVRSLSYLVPTLIAALYSLDAFSPGSLYTIGISYVILGNVLSLFLGAFLLPRKIPSESMKEMTSNLDSASDVSGGLFKSLGKKACDVVKNKQFFEFCIFVSTACLFTPAIEFINKSQRDLLVTSQGSSAVNLFKYINVLTFVPAPFLGFVMDHIGPAPVMNFLHVCCALYYLFAAFDTYAMKVSACFMYFIAGSICVSSYYCYVNERFPREYFGLLISIVFFAGGAFSFINIPLYNYGLYGLEHLKPLNFRPITFILLGYMVVATCLSGVLVYITKFRPLTGTKEALRT